jgi:hypothetical protein
MDVLGVVLGLGIVVAAVAMTVVPVAEILRRTGFSRSLALISLIPVVNVVALWMFAFGKWPSSEHPQEQQQNWSEAEKEKFRELMRKSRGAR